MTITNPPAGEAGGNDKLGKPYQALYGVIQGSVFEDLRERICQIYFFIKF